MEKVTKDSTGCWLFTGARNHRGYGQVGVDGKTRSAHRIAYEALVGPIPDGLHIDHLCRVRNCVRPDHLEPVTNAENRRRSVGFIEPLRTECSAGHERNDENTYRAPNGVRHCRPCQRARSRTYKQRVRAAA